jgi:lipopolysaccharide transport system permease protein
MSAPVLSRRPLSRLATRPAAAAPPSGLLGTLRRHRFLIAQLTRREVIGRYRGSHLGIFWSFINPLLLLCIYTFVFKYIFHAKMTGHRDEGWADFALQLFAALIIFNLFAECLGRAPNLILVNTNYVTKVVFPLELLPLTVVLGSLVHLFISFVPLCLGAFITRHGHLHATVLLWPLLLVPIIFWALAITWIVSALGAFLRDLNEVMLALTQILMYASAIFYPFSGLKQIPFKSVQMLVRLNPLAYFSEQSRNLVVWGEPMDWTNYGWVTFAGMLVMIFSYKIFMNVKPAFADVI